MKMSKWIGYAVSVNCGKTLGCYQGTILEADGTTITLTKAFRNGFPYPKSQVTLNAADIKELKIIEARSEQQQTHSTVAVSKTNKKAARATVCENLQANPSSSTCLGNQANQSITGCNNKLNSRSNQTPLRSKPIEIQGPRPSKNNSHNQTGNLLSSTPKARGAGAGGSLRRRDEACFGQQAEPGLQADFDFEGNLALFDKQALWEQMSQKPDLVRQTDEAGKFRHDENILGGIVPTDIERRHIRVPPALRGAHDYVTDEGGIVPTASAALRRALWSALQLSSLLDTARVLLARGAVDVCVKLVGGGRRLEARNAHQAPTVAVLCAPHVVGVAALIAARLLASHNVRVLCYVQSARTQDEAVTRELSALAMSGVRVVHRLDALPRPDAVLLALHDVLQPELTLDQVTPELEWARASRAAVVVVEPAGVECGEGGELQCRAALCVGLPPALPPPHPRVYLVSAGVPPAVYHDLRVQYRPPFGAAPLLALHPAED